MAKIWRMYPNGEVKNESHVLWPHRADGRDCTGYNGDVAAWSRHNQQARPGCAQIVQDEDGVRVLHNLTVEADLLGKFMDGRLSQKEDQG